MSALLHQGRATYAFFERNWNLTKRYWAWEVVWLIYNILNAMSITFIGDGAGGMANVKFSQAATSRLILTLLIGTSVWTYLSSTFEGVTDMVNIERWEGTIEHTFMAPISRFTHLVGSCWFAVVHGMIFTFVQLFIVSLFFHVDLSQANYLTAIVVMLLGSFSFIGFGIGASILPLLFTEKGAQMSFIVRAVLLVVSGVYYQVSILPQWMQFLAIFSPATYVLDGLRAGLINGTPLWTATIWASIWPLLILGVVSIPLGIYIFGIAERYAKRTGRLKRNG